MFHQILKTTSLNQIITQHVQCPNRIRRGNQFNFQPKFGEVQAQVGMNMKRFVPRKYKA
jgi:hypothetical protein